MDLDVDYDILDSADIGKITAQAGLAMTDNWLFFLFLREFLYTKLKIQFFLSANSTLNNEFNTKNWTSGT